MSEAPYPAALGPLDDPPDPGAPPLITMSPTVDARVRAAVVKVTGRACRQIQDGSGWAVAPDLVVTNAHVVAGERDTRVEDVDGRAHDATVVAFDAKRDLAVLSVPGLDATPLPLEVIPSPGPVRAVLEVNGGTARRLHIQVGDRLLHPALSR